MPDPKRFTLFDLKVDEVSFVDRGDNPEAHIPLFKRDRSADDGGLPKHVVAELIKAEADSDETDPGKGTMTTTLQKKSDVTAVVKAKAEELMNQNPELTPAQARVEVWYENPDLRIAYEQAAADRETAVIAAAATGRDVAEKTAITKGVDTLKKHAAKVEELKKADPRLSLSEARRLAWTPALRDEYNRAHGAA